MVRADDDLVRRVPSNRRINSAILQSGDRMNAYRIDAFTGPSGHVPIRRRASHVRLFSAHKPFGEAIVNHT